MKLKKYSVPLLAVLVLIFFDQWTKWLAVQHLMGKEPIALWPGVFELHYLENRGAAFGIFQNQLVAFFILTFIIGAALLWFYFKIPDKSYYFIMRIPVVVCFAGAVGNFIDRAARGYVVDFFYFKLIDFPIFNVADIYLTCSTVFFVLLFIFKYKEEDFNFLSRKGKVLKASNNETTKKTAKEDLHGRS